MSETRLAITDNRTGRHYEIPVADGVIRAIDLRQIKMSETDFGLMSYDPGFTNTASCRSKITLIDGEKGILRYRGYPIEQLAGKVDFPTVAYLIFFGELPTPGQSAEWTETLARHALPPENIKDIINGFPRDAYPMAMLMSCVAALSGFYPEGRDLRDQESRRLQLFRLVAQVPVISAYIYRHKMGLPYVSPSSELAYTENFLAMMFRTTDASYAPPPVFSRVLDVLFVLHADHEQNCSANAMRSVGSSRTDPFLAAAAAIGALAGPLHGGANEAVLRMLQEIGSKDQIPKYVERVKKGDFRLMGFGHRVYKNYDPRAKIIKGLAYEVFEVTGTSPLLEMALELERIALHDQYFTGRKLYPNVDFYSGLIYQAMGFPSWMFSVLFALARMSGWIAQWEEMLLDSEQRLARPRQIYEGADLRNLATG
ncbi:MAG: citrate synthase, partial [Acidobacteriota bacterium]